MSSTAPFGLYPTRSRVDGERVLPGAVFTLGTPVVDGGVTLFRRSLWLAVPVAARGAATLQLAASALALRFDPLTLEVPTDDPHWFDDVDTGDDDQTVHIEFAWPATVTALPDPSPTYHQIGFDLYRADGDRRADEPTMSGQTGVTLASPWIGSPMVVVMQQAVHPTLITGTSMVMSMSAPVAFAAAAPSPDAAPAPALAAAAGASAAQPDTPAQQAAQAATQAAALIKRTRSHVVPTITLRGVPSSPRAKLVMEARGGAPETLLWQALLPGEQGTVSLPALPLVDEWGPALEQVRKRLADEAPPMATPLLLRLDIESDAPCRVTLSALALALDGEFECLPQETRVDFDGTGVQSRPLPLAWPAGGALQGLKLSGRVGGGTAADAGAAGSLPADLRRGLLLSNAARVRVHALLDAPARLGGLSLAWHPLSDTVALTLRLLGDAGDAPSAVPLTELPLRADTPAPGWLALRMAAPLDLQARHLWLEATVEEGSGLWLADAAAPVPMQGYCEARDTQPPHRQPLGLQPAFAWLPPALEATPDQPRQVGLFSGSQVLAAQLDERFELECPGALLSAIASQGLQAQSGSAARLTLVSARARLRLA